MQAQTKEIDDKTQQLKDENVMLNSQLEAMGKDNTSREEEFQKTIQQLDVSYVPTHAYLLSYSTVRSYCTVC